VNSSVHTIGTCCEFIKNELNGLYPEREIHSLTDLILFHILGIPKHEIHVEKGKMIDEIQNRQIAEIIKDLKLYKPIQYIIGYTEFYGLQIRVSPDVLIPRPETEEIVKWIIDDHKDDSPDILDIGTGSGCIAIALKKNLPKARVSACDISNTALELAKKNAEMHGLYVVFFHQDIIADSLLKQKHNQRKPPCYDIIVSNPPYIPLKEKPLISRNISNFEPEGALFVTDEDPLIFYRHIANVGMGLLKLNGLMYLEIHENSCYELSILLEKYGYRDIFIRRDINGKIRMIRCIKKNE
jgi:release factor glutamine methyltransferase